jgi:hypothetical protein
MKRRIKYPEIGQDAKRLGVTRSHLAYVLNGERISPALLERYNTLQRVKRDVKQKLQQQLKRVA